MEACRLILLGIPHNGGEPEDGYVGQLPGHVAAPLVHGGMNPIVGGASADTRLATQLLSAESISAERPLAQTRIDPGCCAEVPEGQKLGMEPDRSSAFPTDSKERENDRRRRLKKLGWRSRRKRRKSQ